jgi:predicted protein tyrosine phosphatase
MPIIVCPLSRVPDMAREKKPSRVVSLLDPDTPFPELTGYAETHRLKLPIHDIELEMPGYTLPCEADMRAILNFVTAWDRAEPILIHCYAGISRSTATAFITACVHNPHIDEEIIAQALRKASKTASPNRRFIALADAALGRKGRMSAAIERIGRGGSWFDIGEAQPFTLASRYDTA